jgi:hypothetical protein
MSIDYPYEPPPEKIFKKQLDQMDKKSLKELALDLFEWFDYQDKENFIRQAREIVGHQRRLGILHKVIGR